MGSGYAASVRRAVVGILVFLAGCLSTTGPYPTEPGPTSSAGPSAWSAEDCQTGLQVWLIPIDELRRKTPPEFPPSAFQAEGLVETPMGRLVFYLYDCPRTSKDGAGEGGGLLGLLAVRVTPPRSVMPPEGTPAWATGPWATLYALHVVASGGLRELANESGLAWEELDGRVTITRTAIPDAPVGAARLQKASSVVFEASWQGIPGQVENFSRPERYYSLRDGEVRWLDVGFLSTLWESAGRVTYAADSPWARAVGNEAYNADLDHHSMIAKLSLAWKNATLAP